jgi:hypothetical protein
MRINPHITTTALVVALGISAAPAAAGNTAVPNPVVRPNPDEQVRTSQPSHARPLPAPSPPSNKPCSEICSGGPPPNMMSTRSGSEVVDNGSYGTPRARATIVRVSSPHGFDWGDAGIGAAGGIGLSILVLAGPLTLSQRRGHRERRSSRSTALTS